ncbi:MAG TPA: hypothetical protein DCM05_10615 [Elusimicrobia bacterium]|nr:hypothetical protein [Elusimicrobiota bacterium]
MLVHRGRAGDGVALPNVLEKLAPGQDAAALAQEVDEEVELDAGELQGLAGEAADALVGQNAELAEHDGLLLGRRGEAALEEAG